MVSPLQHPSEEQELEKGHREELAPDLMKALFPVSIDTVLLPTQRYIIGSQSEISTGLRIVAGEHTGLYSPFFVVSG